MSKKKLEEDGRGEATSPLLQKEKSMKLSLRGEAYQEFNPFLKLLQIMHTDPHMNDKVITLVKMDSCERRYILKYWLEQLRKQSAFENLSQALSCLFDDTVSEDMLKILIFSRFAKR